MRNLKKFLALVLAMMMTFSLMVTVNAATTSDFTDKDAVNEKFTEAIDVLKGMGVFEGYEDGTFQPKGEITRAEVATIVYRLATGDAEGTQAHLYKDYQKFDDVKSDHWAAGYINYCANAEWIAGYGNGKFGPSDKVTGYQAAAMILRAVGYGKNNEFVGPTWQVQVANVTRSEGLLVNVDNTNYANTLNYNATRELVAEILFRAANIPTVTWTMLGGYNKYTTPLATGGVLNDSLGYANYGLTHATGIVQANENTGLADNTTRVTLTRNGGTGKPAHPTSWSYDAATYDYAAANRTNLKYKSGLDMIGHKVEFWFDDTGRGATQSTAKTVYALTDKVVKSQLVYAGGDALLTTPGTNTLGDIATDSRIGFKTTSHNSTNPEVDAYYSAGFGTLTLKDSADDASDLNANDDGKYKATYGRYVVISNSANKQVDVVIAVNVQIGKISNVDNINADKTVTHGHIPGGNAPYSGANIKQDSLLGDSCTTLGALVVGNAIGTVNTNGADEASDVASGNLEGWVLNEMTKTVTGTVTSYHTGTATDIGYNVDPDYVMLSDGTKLEKSLLSQLNPNSPNNVPQLANMSDFEAGNYKFWLDSDGKFIAAQRIYGTEFIYGTYADAEQATSTSTFKYFLTGVTLDGEIVTKAFDNWNSAKFNGNMTAMGAPYRNTTSSGNDTGIGNQGKYKGFVLNDTALTAGFAAHVTNIDGTAAGISGAANAPRPNQIGVQSENVTTHYETGYFWNTANLNITSWDANVGAVQAATKGTAWTPNGDANNAPVYLTNDTKFILVSGHGTDTLKVEKFTGLKELLGSQNVVSINTASKYLFYYTTSNYQYASTTTGNSAQKIDTIIMPANAVGRSTSVYFYGGTDPILKHNLNGNLIAEKYALYQDGEKVEVWLTGSDGAASPSYATQNGFYASDGTTANTETEGFYTLVPMTDDPTAPDGKPIYKAVAVADADLASYGIINDENERSSNDVTFKAATRDATIGRFTDASPAGTTIYNTANAKVVNFKTPATYNIKTLQDLNEASTLYSSVSVYAIQSSTGVISAIYVVDITP